MNGIKFNRFHTTALCSPTRSGAPDGPQSSLGEYGGVRQIATSAPGYSPALPKNKAPLVLTRQTRTATQLRSSAKVPRGAGVADQPAGPLRPWPTAVGDSSTRRLHRRRNQPVVSWRLRGRTAIEPENTLKRGYHFMEDMTNKAIKWTRQQKALDARQAVLHVFRARLRSRAAPRPERWLTIIRASSIRAGRRREEISRGQKQLGVIPANAELRTRSR